jgi:hypothetical protein
MLRGIASPTTSSTKISTSTQRSLTAFAETTDPHCRRSLPTFGLIVLVCESTISLQGRISSTSPSGRASLSPSPSSARRDPIAPPAALASCSFACCLLPSRQHMTAYHLTTPTTLPSLAVRKAKEKRRQVLAQAAKTRKTNYLRFLKKRRLHTSSDVL